MIYIVFATNLILTVWIEMVMIYLLFRKKEYLYYSLLCNLLTNPVLNLLLLVMVKVLGAGSYYLVLVILEIIVIGVEAFIYIIVSDMKISKAIRLSLVLNVSSFVMGRIIYHLLF